MENGGWKVAIHGGRLDANFANSHEFLATDEHEETRILILQEQVEIAENFFSVPSVAPG